MATPTIFGRNCARAPYPSTAPSWRRRPSQRTSRHRSCRTGRSFTRAVKSPSNRRDAAGRLLMGGRGLQRNATNPEDYRHLVSYAQTLWPALARVEWTHWWNGQFALMPDFLPRFHHPAPGLYIFLGYSGRGLALSSAVGAQLAGVLAGAPAESFALPVSAVRRIPLHRFWRLGVNTRVAYGR